MRQVSGVFRIAWEVILR